MYRVPQVLKKKLTHKFTMPGILHLADCTLESHYLLYYNVLFVSVQYKIYTNNYGTETVSIGVLLD